MWPWMQNYGGGGQGGMPYGLSPSMWQRPGMGTGTMTSAADTYGVSDAPQNPFAWLMQQQQAQQPDTPEERRKREQQRRMQQMQMLGQMGLGMLQPRQPMRSSPYPWI